MIDFAGQVVIVTGAGRGLGQLYAAELARRGASVVAFLASRSCTVSHHNSSACAGRYARAFVGLGEGWLAKPGSNPTADDIEAHLADISATERFIIPGSIYDEVASICTLLGLTS